MKTIKTNLKFSKALSKRAKTSVLVLHHSSAKSSDAATIHEWHLKNGWAGIGYHFVILKDGTIEEGRPIDKIGAHAQGHNSDSIGVCFEGDFDTEKTMNSKQLKAGKELIEYIKGKYPNIKIVCHRDLMATDCPGKYFPLEKLLNKSNSTSKKSGKAYSGVYPKIPFKGYLGYGDHGFTVKQLQVLLNWYGNYNLVVDGYFGSKTEAAVIDYQRKEKLVDDGQFGPKSLNKMKTIRR